MAALDRKMAGLIKKARRAAQHAHAPYSRYKVGAALLTNSGKVYTGCNIENRSYGVTICAERVALGQAVAAGQKKFKILAISSEGKAAPLPCGICRQALSEFSQDMQIAVEHRGKTSLFRLKDLFPNPF